MNRRAITHIVVRPELLQLKNEDDAEVGSVSYDAHADTFVDLFTDLIGAAPEVTESAGGKETEPFTEYAWDGVRVHDDHERGEHAVEMNVSVLFTKPELGPRRIGVATIQGFKPGDDLRWLARYMAEPYAEGSPFNQIQAEHGAPIGAQEPTRHTRTPTPFQGKTCTGRMCR